MTGESREIVDPFVEQLGATYPILCEGNANAYSTGGVPSAYLISADGKVVWQGHPASLGDSDIEQHLKDVSKEHRTSSWAFMLSKQLPPIPDKLSSVRKALEDMKFGAALKTVDSTLAKLEGEEKSAAEALREWIAKSATTGMEKAAGLLRDNQAYKAQLAYEEVASRYKGHDFAKQADEAVKAMKKDKAIALELKAGEMLDKAKKELRGESKPEDQLECLKALLSKKYEETQAGKEAAALAAEIEKTVKK